MGQRRPADRARRLFPRTRERTAPTCTWAPCWSSRGRRPLRRVRGARSSARLHLVPRYRQQLAVPAVRRVAGRCWVDDPHFNARYHVRHTALPRPGGRRRAARAWPARVFAQQLDRDEAAVGDVAGRHDAPSGRLRDLPRPTTRSWTAISGVRHPDRALRSRAGPAGARAGAGLGSPAAAEQRGDVRRRAGGAGDGRSSSPAVRCAARTRRARTRAATSPGWRRWPRRPSRARRRAR